MHDKIDTIRCRCPEGVSDISSGEGGLGRTGRLLALAGALIGIGLAWGLFHGQRYAFGETLFHLAVTPGLVGLGFAWALAVAMLGGILPAVRAGRLPVVDALRAV